MSPRLHHANVVVGPGETERVADFYVDVLGLRRAVKPTTGTSSGGAWFDIGDTTQLHVSERPDAVMHDDAHIGLVVDDFDVTLERIAAAGAPWQEQADLFGGRRGSTRDPLGNRFEILERSGRLA